MFSNDFFVRTRNPLLSSTSPGFLKSCALIFLTIMICVSPLFPFIIYFSPPNSLLSFILEKFSFRQVCFLELRLFIVSNVFASFMDLKYNGVEKIQVVCRQFTDFPTILTNPKPKGDQKGFPLHSALRICPINRPKLGGVHGRRRLCLRFIP